jgi:hypothetical protein
MNVYEIHTYLAHKIDKNKLKEDIFNRAMLEAETRRR